MMLPRFKRFTLLLAFWGASATAADLPAPVHKALRSAGIPLSNVAVVVQEVGSARPAIALNAEASLNPASLMKLVTTYAALERLGPAYRWRTEVYVHGEDVILRGTGDPKLTYESFWILLRALRSRGIRDVRGDLVLDRSHFAPIDHGRIDDDAFRPYNVPPDALLLNFKALRFTFLPAEGDVRVFAEPALPGLEIVNGLKVVSGSCPEGRAFRELIQASFQAKPPRAAFTGSYPALCGEKDLNVALHTPEDYVAGMVRQLWGELGGTWIGTVREGATPPGAKLVYVHHSESLAEYVRDINKFSNNVMARQLYLTLAAEVGGPPARPAEGWRAVREILGARGIAAPELVMENGSGLSRIERASAGTLAALLLAAWRSPVMPEFISSLPLAATDGTMRKRLVEHAVAGHAHVKTGLLQDARSIGGYVLDRHGRRHAVVMIVNHPRAHDAQPALDALLAAVYEGATARARPRGGPPAGGSRRP